MVMYLCFLGASLLETYWLFVTCGRATVKIARFWFVMDSWPLWLYVSPWLFLLQDLVAFGFSAALVFPSVVCILELACCTYRAAEAAGGVDLDEMASRGTETEKAPSVTAQDTS